MRTKRASRRRGALHWAVLLLAVGGAAGLQAQPTDVGIRDGYEYFIEASGKSGSCLTVEGFLVLDMHCFKRDYRQIFRVRRQPGGWKLIPQHSYNCLQAGGEGSEVREAKCSGDRAQLFEIDSLGDGRFEIKTKRGLCLEVEEPAGGDQAPVFERKCAGSASQSFKIPMLPKRTG